MGLRIAKGELQQVLARVQPGLATADVYEQASCLVFSAGWLMTYNGEIACRTKSGLPKAFEGAVRAKPLMQALATIPDEEIELDLDDPSKFRVSGTIGRRKEFSVRMESEILLPIDQVQTADQWLDLPEDFSAALNQVLPSAGKSDQEFLTSCVYATPDYLQCTDRLQLCRYHIKMPCQSPFLFRARSAKHLLVLDVTRFGESENWVHFRNGAVIFSCGRFSEDMQDLTSNFSFRGTPARLAKEAEAAANLADVFQAADKTDDKITVELRPGRMVVIGRGAYGEGVYPLEAVYDGPPMSFRITPKALIDLVKNYDSCEVGTDDAGRSRLRVDGERWTYLVALGKVESGSPQEVVPEIVDGEDSADSSESEE